MTIRTTLSTTIITLLCSAFSAGSAFAHGAEANGVDIHVGDKYDDCYFDLHSELTKNQFKTFAAEAGQIIYFRPIASADTLGKLKFDVSLSATHSSVDDSKGAWNNTMSHPEGDHYLGTELTIPQLTLRFGVSENVDVEAYGTVSPTSNYGFVGIASKWRLINQHKGAPVSLAIRPHLSALIGPVETTVATGGADLLVSREFFGLAPFAGVGVNTSVAVDHSDDTDVGHQGAVNPVVLAGLDYNWKLLSLGGQAEYSVLPTYSLRLGARF